jgi:hypothetical protein
MNIKDKTGIQSVMQLVCKILCEEDQRFYEFKSNLKLCFETNKMQLDDVIYNCHK